MPREVSRDEGVTCPKCRLGMTDQAMARGVKVKLCPQCQGTWLDHGQLKELVGGRVSERPGPRNLLHARRTEFKCPQCGLDLFEREFDAGIQKSGVMIEQCNRCAGMFLDYGKLGRIRQFLRNIGLKID